MVHTESVAAVYGGITGELRKQKKSPPTQRNHPPLKVKELTYVADHRNK